MGDSQSGLRFAGLLGSRKLPLRFNRMNIGLSAYDTSAAATIGRQNGCVDHSDYVTLRQQLHGTFVTVEVMDITARFERSSANNGS